MRRVLVALGIVILGVGGGYKLARADTSTSSGDRTGEGSTLFTGLAQTPEANLFTGALGTRIPIDVPPGRKNVTPKLALVYSSAGGPSPYGYGWDLPIGRIQRSTKWGVPRSTGTHTDDFVLQMPDGTVELVADPPGSTTYRPKVEESYLEVQRDTTNNLFTVYDRSGMKYTFGDGASARVSNSQFTSVWALTHVEDPNGNTMDISYLSYSNVLYPTSINYGANPQAGLASHFYHVRFNYSPRTDAVENDLLGVRAALVFVLNTISVTTDVPSSTTIRSYALHYDGGGNGQNGDRYALSSVSFTGAGGAATYPTQVFSYEPGPNGLAPATTFAAPGGLGALREIDGNGSVSRTLLDMNGDGIVDLVQTGAGSWNVYFGSPTGFSSQSTTWKLFGGVDMSHIRTTAKGGGYSTTGLDTFDVNGDGIPDFVDSRSTSGSWSVYLGSAYSTNGGWGFSQPVSWSAPSFNYARVDWLATQGSWSITETRRDLIDMNGDGLPDLVDVAPNGSGYTWRVYYNNGAGFDVTTPLTFTFP
jgi:hypothetical protein